LPDLHGLFIESHSLSLNFSFQYLIKVKSNFPLTQFYFYRFPRLVPGLNSLLICPNENGSEFLHLPFNLFTKEPYAYLAPAAMGHVAGHAGVVAQASASFFSPSL
jgi:hypothetical protein